MSIFGRPASGSLFHRDRADLIRQLIDLAPEHAEAIEGFFREQRAVADAVWPLIESPSLLPPFGSRALCRHIRSSGRYLSLLRYLGRPLLSVLERYGLDTCRPVRTYVDAVSMITVQAPSATAEAPFALATLDYFYRGTGHVHGGIERLAYALVEAVRAGGGTVRFSDDVKTLARQANQWRVTSRRGTVDAPAVVANLLPQDVRRLLNEDGSSAVGLKSLESQVGRSWGAAMLYLRVQADALARDEAHHLELVQQETEPLSEGNHLFCSVSGRDESRSYDGLRTVTVSTHVPITDPMEPVRVAATHERMKRGVAALAPELWSGVRDVMTASPRTFQRFTGRHRGFVGGVPRTAGWHNYRGLSPQPVLPGLYLVGRYRVSGSEHAGGPLPVASKWRRFLLPGPRWVERPQHRDEGHPRNGAMREVRFEGLRLGLG